MPYEIDDKSIRLIGTHVPIQFYDANRVRCEIYLRPDNTLSICGAVTGSGTGSGGVTVHSALSGLSADDHLQYLLKNGTRALTGNWDAGLFDIISDTIGADSYLYAGAIAPSWKFSIGSADDTDQIGIYHDNTDAYFTTDDGRIIFITDEGLNTDTYVLVRGKGTGVGHLTVHDEDNAEYVELTAAAGAGYVRIAGITPGILHIQDTAEANVTVFSSAVSGETRELLVYGFRAADALRVLEIGVGVDAADTASFDGLSNYRFDGTLNAITAIQLNGTSINTGGTLTNVAYLDQANVFAAINTFINSGLHILDTNASHDLIIKPGSDLTADRIFTLITGDAARTLSLSGNLTIGATTSITGGGTLALASYTLTVPATGTAALGAGTLTVSSANNIATATHTHAIASSSNPHATASILATTAAGHLILESAEIVLLTVDTLTVTVIDALGTINESWTINGNATVGADTSLIFEHEDGQAYILWNGALLTTSVAFKPSDLGINQISDTEPAVPFAGMVWLDP